jgi:hypothetical protein
MSGGSFGGWGARALLIAAAVASSALAGCGFLKSLSGNNTISLEGAQVKAMSVDIRRDQKTICPRASVQLAVFADVVREGESATEKLETWAGPRDANKNDKLDFTEFAFQAKGGRVDEIGWFTPNRDILETAASEFSITTTYKRQPSEFTFTTTYKPDYTCITESGKKANPGVSGEPGESGKDGSSGEAGSAQSGGGNGSDGGAGTSGTSGTDGEPGARIEIFATMVKTAHYERLVALVIGGDVNDVLLVPEGQKLTVQAMGGAGGSGGPGGSGGRGGDGGGGNPGGNGGNGGNGGVGGNGGRGGRGGTVELTFDPRFAEIPTHITLVVDGGPGGGSGSPGSGGGPGSGGSPMSEPGKSATRGNTGQRGEAGKGGTSGPNGESGKARVASGDVAARFQGLPNIEVL